VDGAAVRYRDPKTSDEEEYLENLFDTLCTCLMQPSTRTLFFQAEGVQCCYAKLSEVVQVHAPSTVHCK
jgi:beta-catenin-like protein 1